MRCRPPRAGLLDLSARVCSGLAALALLFCAASAEAARLFVNDYRARNDPSAPFFSPVCNLKLAGEIQAGDYGRIAAQLEAFRLDRRRPVPAGDDRRWIHSGEDHGYYGLCLASEGGDIQEALKIADLFGEGGDQGKWMTVVEAGDRCISACAVLFMSAKRRSKLYRRVGPGPGDSPGPGRWLHHTAKLGFHAPRLEVEGLAKDALTPEQASEAYARAIRTMAALSFQRWLPDRNGDDRSAGSKAGQAKEFTAEEIAGILDNDDFIDQRTSQTQARHDFIPSDLLLAILTVPPREVLYVRTLGQMLRWGIEPFGFAAPRHISERMLMVACANVSYARCIAGGALRSCTNLAGGRSFFAARHDLIDRPGADAQAGERPDDVFKRWQGFFKIDKQKLWPGQAAASDLEVWGFALTRAYKDFPDLSYKQCQVRLVWRQRRLVAFDLRTHNGQGPSLQKSRLEFTADHAGRVAEELAGGKAGILHLDGEVRALVRPWVMLPAGRRLADLGQDPWKELEKGGPLLAW